MNFNQKISPKLKKQLYLEMKKCMGIDEKTEYEAELCTFRITLDERIIYIYGNYIEITDDGILLIKEKNEGWQDCIVAAFKEWTNCVDIERRDEETPETEQE